MFIMVPLVDFDGGSFVLYTGVVITVVIILYPVLISFL